jgi:hypothetical protein
MLFFVDQPRIVKIIRVAKDDKGKPTRSRVGTFFKTSHEVKLSEDAHLTNDEAGEVNKAIDVFKRARDVRSQYFALNFPEISREVMEYFEAGASETERELITVAITEALRKIRKLDQAEEVRNSELPEEESIAAR